MTNMALQKLANLAVRNATIATTSQLPAIRSLGTLSGRKIPTRTNQNRSIHSTTTHHSSSSDSTTATSSTQYLILMMEVY
mmetsp:Transcript_3802/g.8479  ORF Transcript_3802/g.8479 Transcript_3802/m.8479 type:complete len:80 (-) Transcript_3802:7-246(-)